MRVQKDNDAEMLVLFSYRFRLAKKKSGYSWAKLSELSGINRQTLLWYRRGAGYPSVGRLASLASILNVSVDHLIGLRDPA